MRPRSLARGYAASLRCRRQAGERRTRMHERMPIYAFPQPDRDSSPPFRRCSAHRAGVPRSIGPRRVFSAFLFEDPPDRRARDEKLARLARFYEGAPVTIRGNARAETKIYVPC